MLTGTGSNQGPKQEGWKAGERSPLVGRGQGLHKEAGLTTVLSGIQMSKESLPHPTVEGKRM
jgi:hypothetical protein